MKSKMNNNIDYNEDNNPDIFNLPNWWDESLIDEDKQKEIILKAIKNGDLDIIEFSKKLKKKNIINGLYTKLQDEINKSTEEEIEKAVKDISKLRKVKKLVTRGGKTFYQTVYVKDGLEEIKTEKEVKHLSPLESIKKVSSGDIIKVRTKRTNDDLEFVDFLKSKSGEEYLTVRKSVGSSVKHIKFSSVLSVKKIRSEEVEKDTGKDSTKVFSQDLHFIKPLGGSFKVVLRKDGISGRLLAVKIAGEEKEDQMVEEKIADAIYSKLGFNTATYVDSDIKNSKVTEYIQDSKELGALSSKDKEVAKEELKKGFVVDALLANWDVIGQNMDNILVKDGKVYRIDNGGSLEYRARGESKGSLWSRNSVPELFSMRDSKVNFVTGEIFGDITDEEIKKQVEHISKNKKAILAIVEDSGKDILAIDLKGRIEYLENKYLKKSLKKKEVLRKDMPSLVTQNYFDNSWDDLELEGNKKIKEVIKNKILETEKNNEENYKSYASNLGMSLEEYKKEAQELVEKAVSKSEFYVAIHGVPEYGESESVFQKIFLKDGRFKSQFETHTSSGSLSSSSREDTEFDLFGIKKDSEKKFRPIYGYFSPDSNGVCNDKGEIPPLNRISQYGDVFLKVKKEVALKKGTITFCDSLATDHLSSSPIAKPHFTSYAGNIVLRLREKLDSSSTNYSNVNYTECQYHNQLGLKDIESVHLTPESFNEYSGAPGANSYKKMNKILNDFVDYSSKTGNKDIKIKIF